MEILIRYPEGSQRNALTGNKAGQGSFATCYRVSPALAAKIYTRTPQRKPAEYLRRKLTHMAAAPQPHCPDADFIAWPIATIHHPETDQITGYLMRAMPKGFRPLLNRKRAPAPGWQHAVAKARSALDALHRAGIVIGDINGSNLQCDPDGRLALLDCDGWQICAGGQTHYAQSATERLTCPQLLARYRSGTELCHDRNCPGYGATHLRRLGCDPREPRHDRYALQALERRLSAKRKE